MGLNGLEWEIIPAEHHLYTTAFPNHKVVFSKFLAVGRATRKILKVIEFILLDEHKKPKKRRQETPNSRGSNKEIMCDNVFIKGSWEAILPSYG